jgi:cell division transport system permease protein
MALGKNWRRLKRLLAPQLDIPFAKDDINRYLPWFIGLMVFLTGLFLAVGITVGEIVSHKRSTAEGWLTIQITQDEGDTQLAEKTIRLMKQRGDIGDIRPVSREDVAQLVSPWFGSAENADRLPLPAVIEARWKEGVSKNIISLSHELKKLSPYIIVDDHQQWIDHYLDFIQLAEMGAYALALIVILATAMMVIFTSRTALKLHEDAVWLLQSVGAVDDYITRQFQFNAFLLGMRGALVGTLCSAILFFCIGLMTAQFQAPLLPSLPITSLHMIIWLMLPVITGLLSMFSARKAVQTILRQMA